MAADQHGKPTDTKLIVSVGTVAAVEAAVAAGADQVWFEAPNQADLLQVAQAVEQGFLPATLGSVGRPGCAAE